MQKPSNERLECNARAYYIYEHAHKKVQSPSRSSRTDHLQSIRLDDPNQIQDVTMGRR
jgi:hypothetical protein